MANENLMEQWIKALRSGKYQQTQRTMYDGHGYCCLGVADVVCFNATFTNMTRMTVSKFVDDLGHSSSLPYERADYFNLHEPVHREEIDVLANMDTIRANLHGYDNRSRMEVLVHLNDSNHDFSVIADAIEKVGWHKEVT